MRVAIVVTMPGRGWLCPRPPFCALVECGGCVGPAPSARRPTHAWINDKRSTSAPLGQAIRVHSAQPRNSIFFFYYFFFFSSAFSGAGPRACSASSLSTSRAARSTIRHRETRPELKVAMRREQMESAGVVEYDRVLGGGTGMIAASACTREVGPAWEKLVEKSTEIHGCRKSKTDRTNSNSADGHGRATSHAAV
jgi:hypothetical protein